MTILSNSYNFIKTYQKKIFLIVSSCLLMASAYNLGSLAALEDLKQPVQYRLQGTTVNTLPQMSHILDPQVNQYANSDSDPSHNDPTVVASKNSKTKLYHFTWCSGATRIAEKNKIIFSSEEAAKAAGYTLAANCQK